MTKDEIALDALCLKKFGMGFSDLPDLTNATDLFADGYSAQEVFDVCCQAWIAKILRILLYLPVGSDALELQEYPNIAIVAGFVNDMTVAEKRRQTSIWMYRLRKLTIGWLHELNERREKNDD